MKKIYLFIVLIILSIISLFVGVTNISVNDIMRALHKDVREYIF